MNFELEVWRQKDGSDDGRFETYEVEGITLDIYGYVSEGSGENIFVIYDNTVYTPPLSASVLAGITRSTS